MDGTYYLFLVLATLAHLVFLAILYDPLRIQVTQKLQSLGWDTRSSSTQAATRNKSTTKGTNNGTKNSTMANGGGGGGGGGNGAGRGSLQSTSEDPAVAAEAGAVKPKRVAAAYVSHPKNQRNSYGESTVEDSVQCEQQQQAQTHAQVPALVLPQQEGDGQPPKPQVNPANDEQQASAPQPPQRQISRKQPAVDAKPQWMQTCVSNSRALFYFLKKNPIQVVIVFFVLSSVAVLVPMYLPLSKKDHIELLDVCDISVSLMFMIKIERTLRRLHKKLKNMIFPLSITRLLIALGLIDYLNKLADVLGEELFVISELENSILETLIFCCFLGFRLWTELALVSAHKRQSAYCWSTLRSALYGRRWELGTYTLLATHNFPAIIGGGSSVTEDIILSGYSRVLLTRILLYRDSRVKGSAGTPGSPGGKANGEAVDVDSLMLVLRSRKGFLLFSEYLKKSYCSENSLFYSDVEDFKDAVWAVVIKYQQLGNRKDSHMIKGAVSPVSKKSAPDLYMAEQLQVLGQLVVAIFHEYIPEGAPRQINIGSAARDEVTFGVELIRNSLVSHQRASVSNVGVHVRATAKVGVAGVNDDAETARTKSVTEVDRENGHRSALDIDIGAPTVRVNARSSLGSMGSIAGSLGSPTSKNGTMLTTTTSTTPPLTPVGGVGGGGAGGDWWEKRRPPRDVKLEYAGFLMVQHIYMVFDLANDEILHMMSRDVFSRFIRTEEYRDFSNELKLYEMREKELASVDVC